MAIGNWIVVQKLSSPNEYLWDDDARDDVGMRVEIVDLFSYILDILRYLFI